MSATDDYDLAVLGGGLAGLTLTRQLLSRRPETRVVILEKRSFPVSEAAYKVGESTVEIGAHYLSHTLGLHDYLEREHLRKFGLRLFFGAGRHADLANACLLYTSPSPRDGLLSRMPSSA